MPPAPWNARGTLGLTVRQACWGGGGDSRGRLESQWPHGSAKKKAGVVVPPREATPQLSLAAGELTRQAWEAETLPDAEGLVCGKISMNQVQDTHPLAASPVTSVVYDQMGPKLC